MHEQRNDGKGAVTADVLANRFVAFAHAAILAEKEREVLAITEGIRQALPADMDLANRIEVLGTFIGVQYLQWGFELIAKQHYAAAQEEIRHLREALEQQKTETAAEKQRIARISEHFSWAEKAAEKKSARREGKCKGLTND